MKNYQIVKKRKLSDNVNEYTIFAPMTAKHCLAGQFIILRVSDDGERVPFTIYDYSREEQTVSIMVQEIGATTMQLASMNEGDCLADFVGPLGNPTDLAEFKNIVLVGGGIGSAVIFPQAKQLRKSGKPVDIIMGARNKDLLIDVDEFERVATNLYAVTDDGSSGEKGFVTDKLKQLVSSGKNYDCVFAVGPLMMMKAVSNLTRELGIKTIISMNSLMVDGTGMCGGCRLTYDGKTKYACIDGPEFDAHLVDFDEAISRSRIYNSQEKEHVCKLRGRYEK